MESVEDPIWWMDAIHQQTKELDVLVRALRLDSYGGNPLIVARDAYAPTLRHLADEAVPYNNPELAKQLLFRFKALKKWRLTSDLISPESRSEEAIKGFLLRNGSAADAGYLPRFAVRESMKRILSVWLPQVAEGQGIFGPGACAERLTHPKRWMRLDKWISQGEHWPDIPDVSDANHVEARLCAVPKDWYRDRLITVEPCYSSFVQQHVRRCILESIHAGPLRWSAMDLGFTDGPEIQRRLALEASRTGSHATIDLKDASDRISWDAVRAVFPAWLLAMLDVSRTPYVCHKGKRHTLHIFAGMGNATTFPIETLFFAAYVYAVCEFYRVPIGSPQSGRGCTVFGDDIIVPDHVYQCLRRHGNEPCFFVNTEKTFSGNDALRESCGIFALAGNDITVPKIDGYNPRSWDGRTGLADLYWRLVGDFPAIAARVAGTHVLPNYPFRILGYPSISTTDLSYDAAPPLRWNSGYQRWEAHCEVYRPARYYYPSWDEVARRRNSIPARVLLNCSLGGMVSTQVHKGVPCVVYSPRGETDKASVYLPVWAE